MQLIDQIDLMKESTDAMLAGNNKEANRIQEQRDAMVRMYEILDQERQQMLFGNRLRIVVPDDG